MAPYKNARGVAAVGAMVLVCFALSAQASDALPRAEAHASQAMVEMSAHARDQDAVITAEHTQAAPVPEPTGLLMSCLLGGVLLAIGQRLRSWRGGPV